MLDKRLSLSDKMFHIINYLFLFIFFAIVIIPILNVVASSISSPAAVVSRRVSIFPIDFTLDAYRYIFRSPRLIRGFLNTVFYTVAGTSINIALSIMAAYPIARKELKGRKIIIAIMFFTMLFSGGMIPTFLVVRDLGLFDTRWAMLLPGALSVWNVMIMRSFFQNTIPSELYESSAMDGASEMTILLKIVLPLSGPVIAVLTLFYAIGHWNSFFHGLIYLRSPDLLPLQVVLRNILTNAADMAELVEHITQAEVGRLALVEVLRYAIITAGTLPMVILYPFIQKYFTKGIMIGSIKG